MAIAKDREPDTLGLFSDQVPTGNLTVFKAELLDCEQTGWPDLFAGFTSLKAITFSSSLEFLIRLVPQFTDAEIVFGSERILSKEHLALTQASQIVESYGFGDALADQKIFTEALAQYLGKHGQGLLERVLNGSLRFRLLRQRPSHEKLYLLSGEGEYRVVTGSANLSAQAFEGRQQEIYVSFEGKRAWTVFEDYYRRDWVESAPVDADLIVHASPNGAAPVARTAAIDLNDTPIARVLKAGVVIREEPARASNSEFSAAALREAEKLGAELRELQLPKSRTGQTVIDAGALVKAIRHFQARPISEPSEDRVPRAQILFPAGQVILNGTPWLSLEDAIPREEVRQDAQLIADYIQSFSAFFGDAAGAIDAYWAFLVWLYSSPAAPYLRQAAIPVGIDPWVYPVYAVLYGRSSGGKTLFTRMAARSMFGVEKMIRSGLFTAIRALGFRDKLGAVPLLVDDVTRDKFTEHVPNLVRMDQDRSDCYAPIVITTNKDVTAIPADVSKRMVTCHIDAAIPENRSVTGQIARRVTKEIGTALFRAYLLRMIPKVRVMRASIDEGQPGFPDLLEASSETLRGIFEEYLGAAPGWARPLSFHDYFGIRHRKFSEQLATMLAESEDRLVVNRKSREISINFGGDTNQANQFAKTVPDFVLKGRFVDTVRLDLDAVEKEMGIEVSGQRGFWKRLLGRGV
ncbi:MAG: phospholipase D family protein [Acidobacteriota bacterium]|nr:phospholipase D family protein [Acidobacteriota bacterium]